MRRAVLLLGLAAACLAPLAAGADESFPARPVRIIVPYEAGGATDILARSLGDRLTRAMGQPFVVENRPGGGGTIGTVAAAQSRPDGYTLFLGQVSSHGIAPSLYPRLQYDAVKDFAPVGRIASIPNVLVVRPAGPYRSPADIVAAARREPGRLTFASSGNGSSIHLTGEMFKARTRTEMVHVPFRGSAPAVTALLGGQVDMIFDNLPSSLPHIQSGALRALAVTSAQRNPSLPDVPTLQELRDVPGMEGFEALSWFGIMAPAGTPEPVVRRLNAEMNAVINSEAFQATLAGYGATPNPGSPADLAAFVTAEMAKWGEVVRESGARVE